MNKNCVIINVARGPIVNEKDLYIALKNKLIGGAIIDTWYRYPEKKIKRALNLLDLILSIKKYCNDTTSICSLI